jgi:DHA1 family bicyclomycin/chloramphenicol resistance-like MFS transporter
MHAPIAPTEHSKHRLPMAEFIALMASMTAINALGVDMMLAALPDIGRALHVSVENHQQLVLSVYIGSFGIGQLFWGPLADRFGRRPILFGAIIVYAAMSFLAAHAGSFELLLGARALQGLSSASTRVLTNSIIRDCYAGRRMAKIMSLAFMVFLAVPILAPTLGQLVLYVAPWHWIFYVLGGFSLCVGLWAAIRLPETLERVNRRPISLASISRATREVLTDRYSIGYTVAAGCIYGGLMGFLNSSQQILAHTFHRPELFTICFASIVAFMAVSALLNARLVEHFGQRLLSHFALLAIILICAIRLAIVLSGHETLVLFIVLSGLTFLFYGLTGSNFGSMAMEPMGHIAGTAASIQGFVSTMMGTAIGLLIGQSFAGTTLPLTLGWEVGGLVALAIVLVVERGRLFHAHNVELGPLAR